MDLLTELTKLAIELPKLQDTEYKEFNMIAATGMEAHEIRHSKMLSELLNPNPSNPHKLGYAVLHAFCAALWDYDTKNPKHVQGVQSNGSILASKGITSKQMLVDLFTGKIKVHTEETVLDSSKRRMDIIIDAVGEAVIVIENKTFTVSHDDQLQVYQDQLQQTKKDYSKYKYQILVYLSPNGDLPINIGGKKNYNENWCVFDYRKICDVLNVVLKQIDDDVTSNFHMTTREKYKIKFFMEDYITMVKSVIFKENPNSHQKCKELVYGVKKNKPTEILARREAIKALTLYLSSAIEENVRKHCIRELLGTEPDDVVLSGYWYTPAMEDYFKRHGEEFDGDQCRIVCQEESTGIVIYVELVKKNGAWTPSQQALATHCNKPLNDKFRRMTTTVTLLTSEQQLEQLEDVKNQLNEKLGEFKAKLADIEKILNTL